MTYSPSELLHLLYPDLDKGRADWHVLVGKTRISWGKTPSEAWAAAFHALASMAESAKAYGRELKQNAEVQR